MKALKGLLIMGCKLNELIIREKEIINIMLKRVR